MSNYRQSAAGSDSQFENDVALARDAIRHLSPRRADDRDHWIKLGMILQSISDELLSDYIAFSRLSDKFKEGECEKIWRGFKPDKSGGVGIGSLIRWAREDSGDLEFGKPKPRRDPMLSLQAAIDVAVASANGEFAGLWTYTNPNGSAAFWVVRINKSGTDGPGKQKKEFRPIHQNGNEFRIGDPPGPLPLYRLHLLPEDGPILLVEGEKPAETGAQVGLPTTTSAHGAQSPAKTNWQPLAGRKIYILPDKDPEGIKYALAAGAILQKLDPPARVWVLEVLEVPAKGDLHDFVELRRAAGKTNPQIRSEIESMLKSAPTFVGFAGSHQGASAEFPEPISLPDNKPPVEPFDIDLLPVRLAPWITDIAARMQCAIDFLYATLMVALAAVIGRKVGIRPKQRDDWLVVVNLWGAVIGRPGVLKSPAIKEVLNPLYRLEKHAKNEFEKKIKEVLAQMAIHAARQKVKKKELEEMIRDGGDGAAAAAATLAEPGPTRPPRRRIIVIDATVEKLGEILHDNPNGVLSFRDELVGLIRSLDKEGQEGARGFYLQAWNGDSWYCYDRIGRGTIDIENAIVSVFGSIQPGPLTKYLLSGAATGLSDDGLLQRFQVVVYPDQPSGWTNHDRVPDKAARDAAYEVFRKFDTLNADDAKAGQDVFEPDGIRFLRFHPEAQERFDAWRTDLELRLRSGDLEEIFESHLAKYRSLVPSLALIYHLVDEGSGPVGLASLERAIRASKYLESHARRMYATALSPEVTAAHALAKKLVQKRLPNPFTPREVYQNGWSLLATPDGVQRAIDVLVCHDWLMEEKSRGSVGAPKTQYHINPRIWERPGGGTNKTGRSPSSPDENGQRPSEGTNKTGRTSDEGVLEVLLVPPEAQSPKSDPSASAPAPAATTESFDFGGDEEVVPYD